jgi:hypothetical protein
MRASQILLGLATATAMFAAVASGCGGSSNSGSPNDSGAQDVTTDHVEAAVEAAPEAEAAADVAVEACVPVDADLTTLPVPDASVLDGGVSIAACVACVRASCASELEACNADCVCLDTIVGCIGNGTGINLTCAGSSILSDPAVQGLGVCVESLCLSDCSPPKAGTDGGDGGDGNLGDAAEQ